MRNTFFPDGTPRLPTGHRGCTYDGCDYTAPLCDLPPTWHVVHGDLDNLDPYIACDTHAPIVINDALDYHQIGECCGEPGAKWMFREIQGKSWCFQEGDEQQLHEAIAAPEVAKDGIRRIMPLLGRALDRAAQERK